MKICELMKMLEAMPDKNEEIHIRFNGHRAWVKPLTTKPYKPRRYWKTMGHANKFHVCPNCQAIYEMVPVKEISDYCKRCTFKKPKVVMCARGVNQYTKRHKCVWRKYNGKKAK